MIPSVAAVAKKLSENTFTSSSFTRLFTICVPQGTWGGVEDFLSMKIFGQETEFSSGKGQEQTNLQR